MINNSSLKPSIRIKYDPPFQSSWKGEAATIIDIVGQEVLMTFDKKVLNGGPGTVTEHIDDVCKYYSLTDIQSTLPYSIDLDLVLPAKEKICKNKTCARKNDIGAKKCWYCECLNPTDY